MAAPVPCLGDRHWITNPPEKIDMLLAHFFESDTVQSYIYPDNVANLQELVRRYNVDVAGFISALRNQLTEYFSRYFDYANVDVLDKVDPKFGVKMTAAISIYITVGQDGVEYSAGRLAAVVNSKFQMVMTANNEGK